MNSIPWNRINTGLLLLVLLAIIGLFASRAYGGPVDPLGPPSVAGTLPQVEPRSPIPPVGWNGTFPITISQSGSYFFTQNLTGVTNTDGIDITGGDVTIDLNGFTLSNQTNVGAVTGIASTGTGNVAVRGGVIRGWARGLSASGTSHMDLEDCRIEGNADIGAFLSVPSTVKNCFVADQMLYGVEVGSGSTIEDTTFVHNNTSAGGGQALLVDGNNNTVDRNRFYNGAVSDIGMNGSNNIFTRNTWTCSGVVIFGGATSNSMNIDFTKDGTNICQP
jgi:hypothetical protein